MSDSDDWQRPESIWEKSLKSGWTVTREPKVWVP